MNWVTIKMRIVRVIILMKIYLLSTIQEDLKLMLFLHYVYDYGKKVSVSIYRSKISIYLLQVKGILQTHISKILYIWVVHTHFINYSDSYF